MTIHWRQAVTHNEAEKHSRCIFSMEQKEVKTTRSCYVTSCGIMVIRGPIKSATSVSLF